MNSKAGPHIGSNFGGFRREAAINEEIGAAAVSEPASAVITDDDGRTIQTWTVPAGVAGEPM